MAGRKHKRLKETPETRRASVEALPRDERDIVILFVDVVGCSEISNHLSIKEYNEFIGCLQDCFKTVCKHYRQLKYNEHEYDLFDYKTRGDEGCLKIFVPREEDLLAKDIDIAINIALDLKRLWLLTPYNQKRIRERHLPADVGIGIHAGKVFINQDGEGESKYRPEGYAINLAKRVEGESRSGKFSHILVSESSRGQLYTIMDEETYRFDLPFIITPKGISRAIQVFELKHHFLPTDWIAKLTNGDSLIYEELDDDKLQILKLAHENNPTNLWLAEEYLLLSMMNSYKKLKAKNKEGDTGALRKAYAPALEVVQRVANSELRDAGLLGIWGFILGEQINFKEEQKRYKQGLELDEQDGYLHWYLALSISYDLYHALEDKKKAAQFYEQNSRKIEEVLAEFDRALELKPSITWIEYDYACELSWWSQGNKDLLKPAKKMLIDAVVRNPEIKAEAKEEEYLGPIISDPDVSKYLE